MLHNHKLDIKVIHNFSNTRLRLLFPPVILLVVLLFILLNDAAFSVNGYIEIQKDIFFYLNSKLSKLPNLQFNLTQLGDALIFFPFLTVFIVYAPKLWGALLTSSIIALVTSFLLKKLFAIPRPAAIFDTDSFVIIGETLSGRTSLPSGHSITTFTIITILLFAFMPKELISKTVWTIFILVLGLVIVFSRVGVGAHYPLDVVFGSIIGYISALIGIVINNKVCWWNWIKNKKYYPIFMIFFTIWIFILIKEIFANNLVIFYCSLFAIITTLYLIINAYTKKEY